MINDNLTLTISRREIWRVDVTPYVDRPRKAGGLLALDCWSARISGRCDLNPRVEKCATDPFDFAIVSVDASHVDHIIAHVPFRETLARPKRAASLHGPSIHSPFWFTLTVVSLRSAKCPARRDECACARQVAARVSHRSSPPTRHYRWRRIFPSILPTIKFHSRVAQFNYNLTRKI